MKTIEAWKGMLRGRLREAMVARDKHVVAVLREALSALDNAEAVPPSDAPTGAEGAFAGSVSGLGAAEALRLQLAPEAVVALMEREVRERRVAAEEYERLGRDEEARVLRSQVDVLVALLDPE